MKTITAILLFAACTTEHGKMPDPTPKPETCTLDLDELCGARPSTDAFYDALSRLDTPELTHADVEEIRMYGDRMTAWASCAATLATEGR